MKRIYVLYDGMQYSIGEEDYDGLKSAIEDAVTSGRPRWFQVNQGEGRARRAELFIGPATSIALVAVPAPDEE